MSTATILANLKDKGGRTTGVRRAILEALSNTTTPLSAQDVLARLEKKNIAANKTTVYRQLDLLVFHKIIREVHLADRTVRYEMVGHNDHHHHLVCIKCHKTEDIHLPQDLSRQEKMIMRTKRFQVLDHSLEFFGLCANCRKKSQG